MSLILDALSIRYPTNELWEKHHVKDTLNCDLINKGVKFSLHPRVERMNDKLITPQEAFRFLVLVHQGQRKYSKIPLRLFMQACNGEFCLPFDNEDWYRQIDIKKVEGKAIRFVSFSETFEVAFGIQFRGFVPYKTKV